MNRTWKCRECGATTEIGYDWLAEHGGPICEKCDCDMELQPNDKPQPDWLKIGEALLNWSDFMGGWDAKCWDDLRVALNRTKKNELVDMLVDKADAAGLVPEDFDDIIHDLAAGVVADVNNGGLDAQVQYLVEGLGAENAEKELDQLIEKHANRTEAGE